MMSIGQAALASGVSSKMIRHYEAIGLLQRPRRTDNGYRTYSEKDLHTLRFIKTARTLGFSLEHIRNLLSLWQDQNRSSSDVKALVMEHIQSLNIKIESMTAMRDTLQDLAQNCHGNQRPDCPIISGIAAQSISLNTAIE